MLIIVRSMGIGDLVKCYSYHYFGELALVLEVEERSYKVYIFENQKKVKLHKSLVSLFKRCPPDLDKEKVKDIKK